jgi:putative membrane-bound dehydrogenase-like protein
MLALASILGSTAGAEAQLVPVGTARVDITPTYPVRLHGYAARREESKGVEQRIWAKALAIGSDETGPSLLLTADVLGISDAIAARVAARLHDEAKISRERVVFAASHTHSAPVIAGVAPNIFPYHLKSQEREHVDRFTKELTDALIRVGLDALKDRRPAKLAWAQGTAGFAMNRRVVRDGKWTGFGGAPRGPVDHSLPTLGAWAEDGSLRAVLVNYACHCTTLDPNDNLISGDWAGYAQEAIERDHAGATAFTVIGCGADANPRWGKERRKDAENFGKAIAEEVKRVLNGAVQRLSSAPSAKLTRISLPLDTLPTREELQKQVAGGGAVGFTAQTFLDRLSKGESLPTAIDYPVQTWAFGDKLLMVFLAGEVVVDYAIRLKRELDPARLWVVAYSNDAPCYIPSERILREGGYEGGGAMTYYGLPARFKTGVEQKIDDAVQATAPAGFKIEPPATTDQPPPRSPAAGLRSFVLKPGFRIELVASEPAIVDPVAIDWGTDGSLWVCEMHDYPSGLDGKGRPGGRIKRLIDKDGDGFFETATTFLDGVPFPTGVMAWRKGVLVCAAPEILYAEDRDGDGVADVKTTLYSGFATENFQARVNGLSYHLDNWIHGANGLIGGRIKAVSRGSEVDIGGRDIRIRPDEGLIEPLAGLTQQGRVHDDWGEGFGGNNSIWIQHYPFPDHYAKRNPAVASPSPAVFVPKDEDSARVFPASRLLERFNEPASANRVTSACSPMIYRDLLLGEEFAGNAFICEPVHNLVHRLVLAPDGITFGGRRARDEQTSEFLASTDNWCRPVQVRTGPDGAIYVVDMYRYVIEHPRWISPERLAHLDVRAGDDKGRIYRIYRENAPPRKVPRIDGLNAAQLAELLESPSGTLRDQVQMRLAERKDATAVPILERLARTSHRPETRMQALCALEGMGALTASQVRDGLNDADPRVQRQAVRLSEPFLDRDSSVGTALLALVGIDDVRLRFQLALSLGSWNDPRAAEALGELGAKSLADPWLTAAVVSSAARNPARVLVAAMLDATHGNDQFAIVQPLAATLAAAGDQGGWRTAMQAILSQEHHLYSGQHFAKIATVLEIGKKRGWKFELSKNITEKAMAVADSPTEDPAGRAGAIRVLAAALADNQRIPTLAKWLDPQYPAPVRTETIRALASDGSADAVAQLVAAWPSLTPAARGETLDALAARSAGALALLSAVRHGDIPAAGIDAARRQKLLLHPDAAVRKTAEEALAASLPQRRKEVLDAYRAAATQTGNAERGAAVFERVCATCHRLRGKGNEVGPDLAALTDTSFEAFLIAILDPNRDVDARYADYLAALADGRVANGVIAAETANAVTLKRADGQQAVLLRTNIESLTTSGRSLMPEGLEKDIPTNDFADLVAYLSHANPPKTFAGNAPEPVRPGHDGSIRLPATYAAIYGPSLVFESEYQNLGYWHSTDDRAVWTFRIAEPKTYTVTIDYACADDSAGNAFQMRIADRTIRGRVGGTGGWAHYRSLFAGEVKLPAGEHTLEMRASAPLQGALIDLRAIVLTPRE